MNKQTNIPKTLLSFLAASLLMWLLINLSKEYKSVVPYHVIYQKLPQNKLWQQPPLQTIDLLLEGTGFKLLTAKISRKKIKLPTHTAQQKNKTDYYILPNTLLLEIQEQLNTGLTLKKILQDSINLKIGNLATKKIPVIANPALQFERGYNLAEDLKIQPNTIDVFGPEMQVAKLQHIEIAPFQLEKIQANFNKEVPLKLPNNIKNIRFSQKTVRLIGTVDKFTEGTLELPFSIVNLPAKTTISTFPKTVQITYKVGLKNFNSITEKLIYNYL